MSKLTSENRGTVRSPSSSEHSELKSDALEKERSDNVQKKSSAIKTIISKNIAEKWISKIAQKEYSITIHPRSTNFTERFLRTIKEKEDWDCVLVDNKLIITSNDPFKIVSLMAYLKNKGYFVEEG